MNWNNKRYHSLDYHFKETYGEKIYKISIDGGMTCPNRDGSLGTRGCIFCSEGGSGDFAIPSNGNITDKLNEEIQRLQVEKPSHTKYFAYFQAYTNTYAPVSYLERIFTEAINHPLIAGLSIATRPDCLPDDVITLLSQLNKVKPVWIELGLQTIHEETSDFIRRGYSLDVYEDAVSRLNEHSLDIITHIIIGLPGEHAHHLMQTIDYLANLPIQGIKLQLLHVLKNTDLANHIGRFHILSMEEYVELVVKCIERLPEHIVIHRLTGDGPADLLIEPKWSLAKRTVLNQINHLLKEQDTWQGKLYNSRGVTL